MNNLTSYLETHYVVVEHIEDELSKDAEGKLHRMVASNGMGAKWELAKDITDKFEKMYEGREWDGDWLDTLEDFILEEFERIQV